MKGVKTMRKLKFINGFTLVECIVAIAILGIASLVMAQIYGAVARANVENHKINESLSTTVANVERQLKSDSGTNFKIINIDGDNLSNTTTRITFTKDGTHAPGTSGDYKIKQQDTDIYIYCAHYENNVTYTNYTSPSNDPIDLRYKYFVYDP